MFVLQMFIRHKRLFKVNIVWRLVLDFTNNYGTNKKNLKKTTTRKQRYETNKQKKNTHQKKPKQTKTKHNKYLLEITPGSNQRVVLWFCIR